MNQAVVLAAGKSSRMWPLSQHRQKSMYRFLGRPLLEHTLSGLAKAGIKDVVLVISPEDRDITERFGSGKRLDLRIRYVEQPRPAGMGDAIIRASALLEGEFFVLAGTKVNCADIVRKIRKQARGRAEMVLSTVKTNDPATYGIAYVRGSKVLRVVEKPKKARSNIKIGGVYWLTRAFLDTLQHVRQQEYSLEQAIQLFIESGHEVRHVTYDNSLDYSLKYPWHILDVNAKLLATLPKKPKVSSKARISRTAVIKGSVLIEDGVQVMERAVIKGPCYIGKNAVIGDHTLIRENVSVGEGSLVGAYTEVKNSWIGSNVKMHGAFLGDSVVDDDARLAKNTVTANRRFDRAAVKSKIGRARISTKLGYLGAIVGMGASTGVNTSLMPGVKIGEFSVIGPGTVVKRDIPDNSKVY